MRDPEIAKRCTRCREEKPRAVFGSDRAKADGLSAWCKACVCSAARARRDADIDAARARERARKRPVRPRPAIDPAIARAQSIRRAERRWRRRAVVTVCKVCDRAFCPLRHRQALAMKTCSPECSDINARRMRVAKEKVRTHRKRGIQAQPVDPFRVFDRDSWRCQLCGVRTDRAKRGTSHPKAPELDHILPLAAGGAHSYENTQCSCRRCNNAKRARPVGQMRLFG